MLLQLPSKALYITITRDRGKKLKMIAPTTVLDEACSQRIKTGLVVSKQDAGELIRQLERS